MIRDAVFFGAPFTPPLFAPLPLGAVMPAGWLKRELETQMQGLTGKLGEFWPDVDAQNGWLGGPGHAWERGPYYLDGYLPLAYLLQDKDAIEKAQKWVEWTLASQREDGSFGPVSNDDWWPRSVMLKALWQYYTAANDKRVPLFMIRYFKYMELNLRKRPPRDWAAARAMETLCTLLPVYGLTGKKFLIRLAQMIIESSLDWTQNFHAFPCARPTSDSAPWAELEPRARRGVAPSGEPLSRGEREYAERQYHFTHVVNNAMALKYPALRHAVTGNIKAANAADEGWEKLMRHHGVAIGLFTGDEHLSGASPSRGTETCAVVEAMYSMETLLALTGNAAWGDRLEKLAFSALPAAISPDRMAHQYLQQANQIRCSDERREWYNNGNRANLFGLEPNFGCCTANRHQGWPRFAQSLWMAAPDGAPAAMSYAPCRVVAAVNGVKVRIEVSSEYPWREDITIKVKPASPVSFAMRLRVPEWARGAEISCGGQAYEAPIGGFARVEREFREGDEIRMRLPMEPRVQTGFHQTAWVERGPALYALALNEHWNKVTAHPFAPDYEVLTSDEWRYALVADAQMKSVVSDEAAGPFKVGNPPARVRAKVRLAPEWKERLGSAAPPPVLPETAPEDIEAELVPYGWTSLRISQFPRA